MVVQRGDEPEVVIEELLAPDEFIHDHTICDFVEPLEAVRARITSLPGHGEAERAVRLLEAFVVGCYEKSEEVDDSSGRPSRHSTRPGSRPSSLPFERSRREGNRGGYVHCRRVEILEAIHRARGDVSAYASLCEEGDVLATEDCSVLAPMCLQRDQPQEALDRA